MRDVVRCAAVAAAVAVLAGCGGGDPDVVVTSSLPTVAPSSTTNSAASGTAAATTTRPAGSTSASTSGSSTRNPPAPTLDTSDEAAAVLELDGQVGQHREEVGERDLLLLLDLDHGQRGAVVVHLEPALGHLPERDREQPVEPAAALRSAYLERHVGQSLHRGEAAADQRDRGAVAQPDRRPGWLGDEAIQHRARRDDGSLGHGRTLPT